MKIETQKKENEKGMKWQHQQMLQSERLLKGWNSLNVINLYQLKI